MNEGDFILGYTRGVGAPYSLYVTDMDSVWRDEPTASEIGSAAAKLGLVDFDTQKIDYLSVQLEAVFANIESSEAASDTAGGATLLTPNGCKVSITFSNAQITLTVQLTKDVTWTMKARKCTSSLTKSFFSSLCLSGFAHHSYLLLQIQQLRKAMRVKEQYTLYLEENYKTVNGTELMDKYKRQNPEEKEILNDKFLDTFEENALKDYTKLVSSDENYSYITPAIKDRDTWKVSSIRNAPKSSDRVTAVPVSQEKRSVKRPHDEDDEDMKVKVKKENLRPVIVPVKKNPNTRKRSQIGYIKRK